MRAEVTIYRDDGTVLIKGTAPNVEQGAPFRLDLHIPSVGPVIENGFRVYGVTLTGDCAPMEPE